MPRTKADLDRAFAIQGRYLRASCDAYDAGDKWEAIRLATVVFTLVHDHGNIHSILSQLGIKHKIIYMASGLDMPTALNRGANRYTPLIEYERYRDRKKYPDRIPEFFCQYQLFLPCGGSNLCLESCLSRIGGRLTLFSLTVTWLLHGRNLSLHSAMKKAAGIFLLKCATQIIWRSRSRFGCSHQIMGRMEGLELATMRQVAEEMRISVNIYLRFLRLRQQHQTTGG
jgi:hypothetical protein